MRGSGIYEDFICARRICRTGEVEKERKIVMACLNFFRVAILTCVMQFGIIFGVERILEASYGTF